MRVDRNVRENLFQIIPFYRRCMSSTAEMQQPFNLKNLQKNEKQKLFGQKIQKHFCSYQTFSTFITMS